MDSTGLVLPVANGSAGDGLSVPALAIRRVEFITVPVGFVVGVRAGAVDEDVVVVVAVVGAVVVVVAVAALIGEVGATGIGSVNA
ncbi:MAG TPA: hypothetical protein VGO30_13990 [Mycobacterium sp.]|nr:hypothetical protein [Mycobacterium sp.]